ncbi:hypothetical protein ES703_116116 [subsurface metagenome]
MSGAGAEGENPLNHLQGLAHRLSAGKGPEVASSILFQAPGNIHPGPFLSGVYLEVREGLVILEADIVMGMVHLDQVQLKDKSLLL